MQVGQSVQQFCSLKMQSKVKKKVSTRLSRKYSLGVFFFSRKDGKSFAAIFIRRKKKKLYKRRQEAKQKQKLFTTRISGTKLSILLDNRKKKWIVRLLGDGHKRSLHLL
jgi:hypothetical protein